MGCSSGWALAAATAWFTLGAMGLIRHDTILIETVVNIMKVNYNPQLSARVILIIPKITVISVLISFKACAALST
jgi:hypothetical protein